MGDTRHKTQDIRIKACPVPIAIGTESQESREQEVKEGGVIALVCLWKEEHLKNLLVPTIDRFFQKPQKYLATDVIVESQRKFYLNHKRNKREQKTISPKVDIQ